MEWREEVISYLSYLFGSSNWLGNFLQGIDGCLHGSHDPYPHLVRVSPFRYHLKPVLSNGSNKMGVVSRLVGNL